VGWDAASLAATQNMLAVTRPLAQRFPAQMQNVGGSRSGAHSSQEQEFTRGQAWRRRFQHSPARSCACFNRGDLLGLGFSRVWGFLRPRLPQAPPDAATALLSTALEALSLAGGEAAGAGLLEGVLASGPPSGAAFSACLAVALSAPSAAGAAAFAVLGRVPAEALPEPVVLRALEQVVPNRDHRSYSACQTGPLYSVGARKAARGCVAACALRASRRV
jgi:hypothetical protein